MLTRIVSALIATPLLLFIVINNGFVLKVTVMLVAILGLNEFYNAFGTIGVKGSKLVGLICIVFMFGITLNGNNMNYVLAWIFLSMILSLSKGLYREELDYKGPIITLIGVIYIVYNFYHIVFISNLEAYYYKLIWLAFISAWGSDTFAYFTGYLFGKNKLCPTISPKKTIEGAIGGVIGSIILNALFVHFFYPELLIHGIIIGLLGSIVGQLGDLTASLFKRIVGIKDYGKIMPGHGGILDRFDSILFTTPLVYYYIMLFIID